LYRSASTAGARVAQSLQGRATDTTTEVRFQTGSGKGISAFATASKPVLGPTQPSIQ